MASISFFPTNTKVEQPADVEKAMDACKNKFNQMLSGVLEKNNQEAHQVESSIFRQLLELGFLLLNLFFVNQNQGDYGKTIKTDQGVAKRGRTSVRTYFSIFGKIEVMRYIYHIGNDSFIPLDILLNFPDYCYSYFLSELVDMLSIKEAYLEGVKFLEKFFSLKLSVSVLETISKKSSGSYKDYYDSKITLLQSLKKKDITVVSFDGKGVPMIKKEAAKIKARKGKGEKNQKKKEALVGVKYSINANVRTAEEVADNLVFPEKGEKEEKNKQEKAEHVRYIASVERSKKDVMEEIKKEVETDTFTPSNPLVCVMDGAKGLWSIFANVFGSIKNKVLILDIIHVLEYIWLIAHVKYKEGSKECEQYVYEKILFILQGKVASYIMELQQEMLIGEWKNSQKETFLKVIKYLKNHKDYMKYDQYLSQGYPIGSGVVESACAHLVKNRMEISGARWGITGAESILKLRSVVKSNEWDNYWKYHTSQTKNNNKFFHEGVNSLKLQQKLAA